MLGFLRSETVSRMQEQPRTTEKDARQYALVQMCRVILNLNELVYSD